jgi:hypothetical protein
VTISATAPCARSTVATPAVTVRVSWFPLIPLN